MWYFIIGYILTGVILNFVGPAGRDVSQVIKENYYVTISDVINDEKTVTRLQRVSLVIILRLMILIFWSVIYFIIFPLDYLFGPMSKSRKDRKRAKTRPKKEVSERYKRKEGLYFHYMGGAGNFTCMDCNYSQELVSFIHSFPMESWNKSGYQCKECGKFHELECDNKIEKPLLCDCGGALSRENRLFCPACKSFDVSYFMEYIT